MNLLKIDSSPRFANSNSRALTQYLAEQLAPGQQVERDLAAQPFPVMAAEDLVALHSSTDNGRPSLQQHLAISNTLIDELYNADVLVIGSPLHNFSVPAALKQWIDYVCRAGKTFKYTEQGPAGLTNIEHAYLVIASGGAPIGSPVDFASPYLSHICRFIGVKHIHIIDACGSKRAPEEVIAHGKTQIDRLLNPQAETEEA